MDEAVGPETRVAVRDRWCILRDDFPVLWAAPVRSGRCELVDATATVKAHTVARAIAPANAAGTARRRRRGAASVSRGLRGTGRVVRQFASGGGPADSAPSSFEESAPALICPSRNCSRA